MTDDDLDIADKFKQAFATYDFSLVTLTREDIDSAIEVFTRINTGGSVLTLFEIMVANPSLWCTRLLIKLVIGA